MSILILQVFVSLVIVAAAVAFFVYTVRARTFEHADRLALAPLADDAPVGPPIAAVASPPAASEEEGAS